MKEINRGFWGKILKIDLSNKKYLIQSIPSEIYKLLIGGKGIATYLLYNELKPQTDPLSEENIMIFATGPLTGTSAPTSNRTCFMTKSPATGFLLDSYCGGFLGQNIKYAGYDAILIKGKSEKKLFW